MPSYSSIELHPNTHPLSSLKTRSYDVIAIGSGWAGRIATARVVKAGLSAIIVEKELIGGECPFWACVPSKALLRPEAVFDSAKAVDGVKQRIELMNKGNKPDVLIMSATPIPRTLRLMLYGDMDISKLDEKPVGRLPIITTCIHEDKLMD